MINKIGKQGSTHKSLFQGSATLMNFDIREPVDVLAGVKNFVSYPHHYFKKLIQHEVVCLSRRMTEMEQAINSNSLEELFSAVTMLQFECEEIGAGKVYYACYHMQKAYIDEEHDRMMTLYPRLVESVIELKRFIRKTVADNKAASYMEAPSAHSIPVAKGFSIAHETKSDVFYCVSTGI